MLSGDLQHILMCVMQPVVSRQRPLLLSNCYYASCASQKRCVPQQSPISMLW